MNNNTSKKLVILGAGESGVGAALLGKQQGWQVFVSDGGKLSESYREDLMAAGINYEQDGHTLEVILTADCVVKSPGIPEKAAIMKAIRAEEIEVCSEIEFGFRYIGEGRIIAITGSNGKSTTTKLTYHLLKDAGYDVSMVGNIGYSFAKQIWERPTAWYVMEVSSFQLDDIKRFRPNIAVILNITPDHLDRYNYEFKNYIASKFRITENQQPTDTLIINQDDPVIANYLAEHTTSAQKMYITMEEQHISQAAAYVQDDELHFNYKGETDNISIHDLAIQGRHNQYNSMAAGISARVAGIRKESIRQSFQTFEGLEHRLEFVATVRGVDYINDSKATNINSVWFALESMKKPTVLILGGQDKGNDYNELMALVQEKVKAIICLGVNNAPILEAFTDVVPVIETQGAVAAVEAANTFAESGDVVLLAPGCASFDLFKNYEDRGIQFKEAVRSL